MPVTQLVEWRSYIPLVKGSNPFWHSSLLSWRNKKNKGREIILPISKQDARKLRTLGLKDHEDIIFSTTRHHFWIKESKRNMDMLKNVNDKK